MPALSIGGPWSTSALEADMIHPLSSGAVEWQQEKGETSPTWSQDAGAVCNADSPKSKNLFQEKVSFLRHVGSFATILFRHCEHHMGAFE